MTNLKSETLSKCFSLLREFITEAPASSNRKNDVSLALNQLERVTAGTTESSYPICIDNPTADGIPDGGELSSICIDKPTADGAPPPVGG